jgi:two-component system nitrate/nitrite response regulator NarL
MKAVIPAIVTHPSTLFRDGLRQILLGTQFRPVYMAADLDENSIKQLSLIEKGVWLLGISKCSVSTCELVRQVKSTVPGVTAIILAQSQTAEDVWPALEAGARGFLFQDISCERLIKSLELISLGEVVVPAEFFQTVRSLIIKSAEAQPAPPPERVLQAPALAPTLGDAGTVEDRSSNGTSASAIGRGLSKRELSILRQLMQGASNKVIARQLVITEATVKVHIKAILRKLRLHNRTQAAMWAYNYFGDGRENHNGAETAFVSATAQIEKPAA